MAVAFDAESESHTGTTGSSTNLSWTHTPSGTPAGVLVFVFNRNNASGTAPGAVTYGGNALSAVTGGSAVDTTVSTEGGSCHAYFLGSGIPTGAQTVAVTESPATFTNAYGVCFTVTASANTTYAGVVTESNNQAITETNVDDGSPGTNSLRFAGVLSGASAVPAAGANSTAGPSIDFGSYVNGTYRETTAGQGSRPVGGTDAVSDDIAAVYLAIIEVVPQIIPSLVIPSGLGARS